VPTAIQGYVLRFHPQWRSALLVLVYGKCDAHGSTQGLALGAGRASGKFYKARHLRRGGWHCLLLGLQLGRNPQQKYEQ
jgi:hypothetical protein